jgi:hypothetical protein
VNVATKFTPTRSIDPIRYDGTTNFASADLAAVFTPDAPEAVQKLFYALYNPHAGEALVSQQIANTAELAQLVEETVASEIHTGAAVVPKPGERNG